MHSSIIIYKNNFLNSPLRYISLVSMPVARGRSVATISSLWQLILCSAPNWRCRMRISASALLLLLSYSPSPTPLGHPLSIALFTLLPQLMYPCLVSQFHAIKFNSSWFCVPLPWSLPLPQSQSLPLPPPFSQHLATGNMQLATVIRVKRTSCYVFSTLFPPSLDPATTSPWPLKQQEEEEEE